MKQKILTVPELVQIASTRVALGAGIGLLLGSKLNSDERRSAGWALLLVGILSTIPIAMNVLGNNRARGRGYRDSAEGEEARFEHAAG